MEVNDAHLYAGRLHKSAEGLLGFASAYLEADLLDTSEEERA